MNKSFIKIDENIDYDLEKSDLENNIDYFTSIKKYIETYNEIRDIVYEIKNMLTKKSVRVKNDVYMNIIENIQILQSMIQLAINLINDESNKRCDINIGELWEREKLHRHLILCSEKLKFEDIINNSIK
jgi:PHP family Zn ribbon phosphoesterase